jgi:hypothetical protein
VVRQMRFRTVVLVVRMSARVKEVANLSISVLIKWLKKT